jgi:hypothetical protein
MSKQLIKQVEKKIKQNEKQMKQKLKTRAEKEVSESRKRINEELRKSKIKSTMTEKFATPVFIYGFFETQAEMKALLGVSAAEINKSIRRGGKVRGFNVIKLDSLIPQLQQLSKETLDKLFLQQVNVF